MVVIGGITRLTWSGLSITEWQPVTGIVPPLSTADWAAEFGKYQQTSQYKLLNTGMSLADFKTIFLWEYVHRLWGRLIGFVYLLPFLYFLVRGRIPRRVAWPLAGIFALGFAQGALGWYMVESGLANRIEVSQYRLTAHLVLALVIYGATLWTALGLLGPRHPDLAAAGERGGGAPDAPPPACGGGLGWGWRRASEGILALVGLTIVAGGFVAGPQCRAHLQHLSADGRQLCPRWATRSSSPFIRNWFENVAAVQFDHRAAWRVATVGLGGRAVASPGGQVCPSRSARLSAARAVARSRAAATVARASATSAAGRADPTRRGTPGRRGAVADRGDRAVATGLRTASERSLVHGGGRGGERGARGRQALPTYFTRTQPARYCACDGRRSDTATRNAACWWRAGCIARPRPARRVYNAAAIAKTTGGERARSSSASSPVSARRWPMPGPSVRRTRSGEPGVYSQTRVFHLIVSDAHAGVIHALGAINSGARGSYIGLRPRRA